MDTPPLDQCADCERPQFPTMRNINSKGEKSVVDISVSQLAEILEDLGCEACSNLDVLLQVFEDSGDVAECHVAHILGMMARTEANQTHMNGVEQTERLGWNIQLLMEALGIVAPALSWVEVMRLLEGNHSALRLLWDRARQTCLSSLFVAYHRDPSACTVESIMRFAISVDGLADAVGRENLLKETDFVMDLAMMVSAEVDSSFSFSQWLMKTSLEAGDESVCECSMFLRRRMLGQTCDNAVPVNFFHVQHILGCMKAVCASEESQKAYDMVKDLGRVRLLGGALTSGGANFNDGPAAGGAASEAGAGAAAGDSGSHPLPAPSAMFASDIEEEANSHFQRIYTSAIEIDRVIQMLKGFKTSTNQREQEVFACMIHNLFDEYRFFPRYPERELLITGKLFGSLIQHQLVSSITLGIALRYVLEALRKHNRTNMFKFGMCALEQFKSRLVEWPQYCHHVNQIAHIRESHKGIIEYIQLALANGRPNQDGQTPPQGSEESSRSSSPPVPSAASSGSAGSYTAQQPFPAAVSELQVPFAKPPDSAISSQPVNPNAPTALQAQAYGAFGNSNQTQQTLPASGGFSQGFGQDPQHQLPGAFQNLASDSEGGSGSTQEASQTIDMRNANVAQALSVVSGSSAFGATTNVDMLLQRAERVQVPEGNVLDKVHFIFNNLSNTNMDQKEKDLLSAVSFDYVPWLCQYVVITRAAQEANYHTLYGQFLDRLDKNVANLLKGVLLCTMENIKILLADDKITASSSVRSLLKNLGSWLGALTLQKNKPILQKDLDFKELIVDAFDKGRLIAVIPFIAKVMDSCANSRIFRPPNPWTMLVLSLLAELHPMTDLKLNIKFEIEVLCKNLNRDLKDVKPTSVFKNRPVVKESNSDWTSRDPGGGLNLKPLPTVPDPRLLAAAAGLSASGSGMSVQQQSGQQSSQDDQPGSSGSGGSIQQPQLSPSLSPTHVQQQQLGFDPMQNVNIARYMTINLNIMPIFQQFPQLRSQMAAAINQAISEIISPVVERSVTIACITTRELILKDFAFETDESQVKAAAHMMVQNLAGSLALVTCKEPLRHSMCSQLRVALGKSQLVDAQSVEQAAQVMAAENLDLGCNLIEKAATEKAVRDIDVALDLALAHRRKPGTPFHEQFLQMQNWLRFFPESLRPKSGSLHPHQKRVYEDFAKLPQDRVAQATDPALRAFNDSPPAGISPTGSALPQQTADHARLVLEKCTACMNKAEEVILRSPQLAGATLGSLPQGHDLTQLIIQARALVMQCQAREEAALGYAHKLFRRLYDSSKFGRCPLGVEWMITSLVSLNDLSKRVVKDVTAWFALADNERRLSRELTMSLISNRLLQVGSPDYQKEMMKVMDMGRNQAAVDHVVFVLQYCLVEKRIVSTSECGPLLDTLTKLMQSARPKPENIVRLLEEARGLGQVTPQIVSDSKGRPMDPRAVASMLSASKMDPTDPPGLRNQVLLALEKWVLQIQSNDDRGVLQFMQNLLEQGWLKGDEITDRFFRICIDSSVDRCMIALADPSLHGMMYTQIDAFSKLVLMLIRYLDDFNRSTILTKTSLLNKVLATTVKVMHQHHAERKALFNQKPFHRMMIRLLQDLTEAMPDTLIFSFADALQACQPRLLPGFSFAWLELASNRILMPRLLLAKANKGWTLFQRLLMGLFKYMEPYLRNAEMHEPIRLLYKGTLRVLLVLLHDFPEFLCEYHFSFCDVIPPSCIQLRNLILSAFPCHMVLPDPFTPQLKVDLLPEINKPPAILSTFSQSLANVPQLRSEVDSFLQGRGSINFLSGLHEQLLLKSQADITANGTRYNVPLINSIVLYSAVFAINQNSGLGKNVVSNSPTMEIYKKLCRDLDTEGRYLFLNAIANQLRFPNSHTHYFSCVLLGMFQCTGDVAMAREQITRVLIERLIVNKPHPWGLLITFIELIKNPTYDFWHHEFVRSSKEIEQLFQSVARFCLPQQGGVAPGAQVSAGSEEGTPGIPAAQG